MRNGNKADFRKQMWIHILNRRIKSCFSILIVIALFILDRLRINRRFYCDLFFRIVGIFRFVELRFGDVFGINYVGDIARFGLKVFRIDDLCD